MEIRPIATEDLQHSDTVSEEVSETKTENMETLVQNDPQTVPLSSLSLS